MLRRRSALYNTTFFLGFTYNFLMALNFTNNAIYPLYVKQEGGTAETVGLFMGVAYLGAVAGRPLIGWLIDRWGVKPVLLMGSLSMSLPSIGYLLLLSHGLTPAVWALRLVHGFGFGAHFSAFFTLAAQTAPSHRRNEAIAMFGFSGLGANLIGPFLGETVFDLYGLPAFFLMVTGFGLLAALVISLTPIRNQAHGGTTPTLQGAFKILAAPNLRLVFALAFLLSMCFSSAQFFLAPLARDRLIPNFGLYFTGYAVAGMTVRLISRRWGDRFGVRRVMVPAFVVYGLGMMTIFFSRSPEALILAGVFSGSAHGIAFPAVNALGYSLAPPAYSGSVIALLTGMMDVGSVVNALIFGQAAEFFGYGAVFPLAAFSALLASILALASVLRRPVVIPPGEDP